MKKKLKLLLSVIVIMVATMAFCAMGTFALTDGDWEFQLLDNEVKITGYLGDGGDVVIPETIYGTPVTKVYLTEYGKTLDNATLVRFPGSVKVIEKITYKDDNKSIKTIQLQEGVEKIGLGAFSGFKALETINLPSTVKVIDSYGFRWCESLKNIAIPDGLTEIGRSAFGGSGITSIDLSKTNATMGEAVFSRCADLKSARLPSNLKKIPAETFSGCSSLSDFEFPAGVEEIGSSAFSHCASIKQVILPVSLKKIEKYSVFSNCDKLTEVVIPYGTTTIGGRTFENCKNLKSVYIPDTVKSIGILNIIENSNQAIIYCTAGSYAAEYCGKNEISYLTDNSVNSGITVLYNGTRISFHSYGQNPELLESRTLVPLRSIFEAMGAEIEWDRTTSTAIAKRDGVEIKIQIGANEMYKDGKSIPVDVPARLLNDRTMVPVRVIAEAFGADVQWNQNGRTVLISE